MLLKKKPRKRQAGLRKAMWERHEPGRSGDKWFRSGMGAVTNWRRILTLCPLTGQPLPSSFPQQSQDSSGGRSAWDSLSQCWSGTPFLSKATPRQQSPQRAGGRAAKKPASVRDDVWHGTSRLSEKARASVRLTVTPGEGILNSLFKVILTRDTHVTVPYKSHKRGWDKVSSNNIIHRFQMSELKDGNSKRGSSDVQDVEDLCRKSELWG